MRCCTRAACRWVLGAGGQGGGLEGKLYLCAQPPGRAPQHPPTGCHSIDLVPARLPTPLRKQDPLVFAQEGWHYELDDREVRLAACGLLGCWHCSAVSGGCGAGVQRCGRAISVASAKLAPAPFFPRLTPPAPLLPARPPLPAPQAPLTFKGVVFNEMKGVYSSPDAVNGRVTQVG